MGDRANVRWKEEGGGVLHFYSHWSGSELPELVAAALDRARDRWSDEAYLARTVFCEMVGARALRDTTGFGISTWIGDGADRVVTVDMKTQTVTDFDGVVRTFGDFVSQFQREEQA